MGKSPHKFFIFQYVKRCFLSALILLIVGCQSQELVTTEEFKPEAESSALTSTDDMRAGSGALGDRSLLPGGPLYEARCASCHEGGVYKAPHKTWLEFMSARNLYKSMTGGIMSSQAEGLSDIEKRQIIEYLTMEPFKESDLSSAAADKDTPLPNQLFSLILNQHM